MERADWHTYQVLTKRSSLMARYLAARYATGRVPSHIWLGVSVEDERSIVRIQHLRATPATIRFVSFEPLLEPVGPVDLEGIDWAIVGGESGPRARPCHVTWIREIVSQCRVARVPVFVKQLGAHVIGDDGSRIRLRLRDGKGGDMSEWPEDLRLREWPSAAIKATTP